MRKLKMIISMLIIFVIVAGMMSSTVSAQIINHYLYTDIIATIDGYEIRTFNIDGYTNVVAEDLRNYGFIVNWDPLRRRLDISRSPYPTVTSYYAGARIPNYMVGQVAGNVLKTDIKTYVEGKLIDSHNIDGLTCVNIEEVAKRLNCQNVYNNYERRLYITRSPFPDFNSISGVEWKHFASHLATYRELDLQVISADAYGVSLNYRLYNEYDNNTISSGSVYVPYHPEIFKYSFQVNSYRWDEVFKVGLVTDMFTIPFGDGREFSKIRLVLGEDGMLYCTTNRSTLSFSTFEECERK
ncbi:MAG: hypothetical protein IKA17_10245 [Clostridia bacterium]|nr:hypothetical protein [Clostridia bacterium]